MSNGSKKASKAFSGDRAPPDLCLTEVEIDGGRYHVLSHRIEMHPRFPGLSPAESQIAERLLLDWTQADIAIARGTSPRTVAKQIENLYRKVGVQSRVELAVRAEQLAKTPKRA